MSLKDHGAQYFFAEAAASLERLEPIIARFARERAGIRIVEASALRPFLAPSGDLGNVAHRMLGTGARPVRAILFDKTANANWSLGWHQDRTICVRRRIDVAGFGPWTRKAGIVHVAPPPEVLADMVTLRLHLDDVPDGNAPLLVAPGSHRLGRIPESQVDGVVGRCGVLACTARAGDIWAYSTPILHASEAARLPARRRVLQVDYAAADLPAGLEWRGVE